MLIENIYIKALKLLLSSDLDMIYNHYLKERGLETVCYG